MSHLPLDARAILQYLNDLGYRNISAEQLREFLKDLRKLIKHEERLAENARATHSSSNNLYKRGTVSSRAKLTGDKDKENAAPTSSSWASGKKDSRTDQNDQEQLHRSNGGSNSDDLARLFKEKLLMEASIPPAGLRDLNPVNPVARGRRRSRSKTRQEKEPRVSSGWESDRNVDFNRMQRRRRSKSHPRSTSRGSYLDRRRGKAKHCDPVALFQYYQKEWAHFRSQIPGESGHMNARVEVRQKLK
ncbi:uncharacterized protein LOC110181180 [Drosophila serrata]|uniref:uncharacterized protein LOC110181180 n=1 Tax=Drosophila serrata TaxID=7274 RepID=UPI000A1D2EDA|nr:uncharacterized protein LOC110181180 [Drosophila serrata]